MGRKGGATATGCWVLSLLYLPMGTLVHAAQAVKGAFPQPILPGVALLHSLQARAARVWWREEDGRPSPYFPLVQGQALVHAKGMGTVKWGGIVPDTACRWITVATPQPMRLPPGCQCFIRAVPSLVPHHALTREVWRAMVSHPRELMTNPVARCRPRPMLEQLTAPTSGVRHALQRVSAITADPHPACGNVKLPGPPRVAAPRRGRTPGRRGGTVVNTPQPVHAQGHWYLQQLLFLLRTAPQHRRQNPYHAHSERLGAQNFPQPAPPALPPGQSPEALQQGSPLDTASTVQQRGSGSADGEEPDRTNCGAVAWTAA